MGTSSESVRVSVCVCSHLLSSESHGHKLILLFHLRPLPPIHLDPGILIPDNATRVPHRLTSALPAALIHQFLVHTLIRQGGGERLYLISGQALHFCFYFGFQPFHALCFGLFPLFSASASASASSTLVRLAPVSSTTSPCSHLFFVFVCPLTTSLICGKKVKFQESQSPRMFTI